MSTYRTRPAAACPEPYDAIPRAIQARDDLTFGAKCLYGALRTAQNTQWHPSYADLATHLSASTRSIVRWVQQLACAGLIAVKRRGQGLSNLLTVLARVTSGRDTRSSPEVTRWRHRAPSPSYKEKTKEPGYSRRAADLMMTRREGRYQRPDH